MTSVPPFAAGKRTWEYGDLTKGSRAWVFYLAMLGGLMNQSNVIFGVNMSLVDVFALGLVLMAARSTRLWIPVASLVFFLSVCAISVGVVLFLVPNWVSSPVAFSSVIRDLVKLATSFMFFVVGVNLTKWGFAQRTLRSFAYVGGLLGWLAIASIFFGGLLSSNQLFYGGFRYRGLMNDPNYYAVLSVVALAVLSHEPRSAPRVRFLAVVGLVGGVLMSGSKTGLLVLLAWSLWQSVHLVLDKSVSGMRLLGRWLVVALEGALFLFVSRQGGAGPEESRASAWLDHIPAISRILSVFTNFGAALVGDGSDRGEAWSNSVRVISESPIVGIGVGTYADVSQALNGSPVLAHNTILQLIAEWGSVLCVVFLLWVLFHVFSLSGRRRDARDWWLARDCVLVFMAGSAAISFNNARLMWFCLGMLWASVEMSRRVGPEFTHWG